MTAAKIIDDALTTTEVADSAVGLSKNQWFVAIVKNNSEKSVAENLSRYGCECYLPLQKEIRVRNNGRKTTVDRVVIPTLIFINCTEAERKEIVKLPYIIRFMSNRAGTSLAGGNKPLAVIPEGQMKKLMFMVGNSNTPVTFSSMPYKKGDLVRVIRGQLAGLEGEIRAIDDKHSEIIVNIDFLGNARLTIDTVDVEPSK